MFLLHRRFPLSLPRAGGNLAPSVIPVQAGTSHFPSPVCGGGWGG